MPPTCSRSSSRARALAFARACRDAMIERFERGRPGDARPTRSPRSTSRSPSPRRSRTCARPGAGDFFGRIDGVRRPAHAEHVVHRPPAHRGRRPRPGRRRLAGADRRAVLPGHRADPFGLAHRRRFTLADGDAHPAYLDEHLDDPDADDGAGRHPRPGARRDRRRPHRRDARDRRHDPGRAGRRHPRPARPVPRRAGRPGHRQDGGRPAPRRVPAVRAPPPAGPRRRARRRAEHGVPRLHRQRAAVARRAQRAAAHGRSTCASPRVEVTGIDDDERRPAKGDAADARPSSPRDASCAIIQPDRRAVRVPLGARTVVFSAEEIGRLDRPRRSTAIGARSTGAATRCGRSRSGSCSGAPARTTCWTTRRRCARRSTRRGRRSSPSRRAARSRTAEVLAVAAAGRCGRRATGDHPRTGRRSGGRVGRPAPRRRGQLVAQRAAVHVRSRRRRRGAGPLRGRPAGDRPAQPDAGR